MVYPPDTLFFNHLKQRDDIAQTTVPHKKNPQARNQLLDGETTEPVEKKEDKKMKNNKTHFCTSTLPKVSDTIKMSNSAGVAEKASSMARMSSTPW